MRLRTIRQAVILVCLVCVGAFCQSLPNGVIVAGESVAGVKLGASLEDFKAVFPKHNAGDQDLGENMCEVSRYQWLDLDARASGVFAYLKDGKLIQVRVQTPRFTLSNGIKIHDSLQHMKRFYPDGDEFVLRYSANKVNGPRDLHYWVDSPSGIAFELYWDDVTKMRRVSSIDIFHPRTEYFPQVCISVPQEWARVDGDTKKRK